jgi:hypothetical protein
MRHSYLYILVLSLVTQNVAQANWWDDATSQMFPTQIDVDFVHQGSGAVTALRFNRVYAQDYWQSQVMGGSPYQIVPATIGGYELFVLTPAPLLIDSLPDFFWQDRETVVNVFGTLFTFRVVNQTVDWGRLDVVWPPMFYGFLTGFLVDMLLGAFRLLYLATVGNFRAAVSNLGA